MEALQANYAKDFFKWFWDSVKHPSLSGKTSNKYFGLTSFIASAAFAILSVMLITSKINGAIDIASSGLDDDTSLSIVNLFQRLVNDGAGKVEFFSVLMIVAFVVLAYAFRVFAVAGTGEKTDFFECINKLAVYTNISVNVISHHVLIPTNWRSYRITIKHVYIPICYN